MSQSVIDLYTASTPNGWKVSVFLEEAGLPYRVHPIDLSRGDQKASPFIAINPNGRIPAIVDRANGDFALAESGAILHYLARRSGQLMPHDAVGEARVMQWVMFQMSAVGPMMGQANVFTRYLPEKLPLAISRYRNECRRLFEVLDRQLEGREFICDEYSIADIANWCWVRIHEFTGIDVAGLDNLVAWVARLEQRPACQRGIAIPEPADFLSLSQERLNMARGLIQR